MTTSDIKKVVKQVTTLVVIHLEAINHCLEIRAKVRSALAEALVPEDGGVLEL
jgi:hypothetical protein